MQSRSLSRREPFFDDVVSRWFAAPFWDRWSSTNSGMNWIPPLESFIDQNRFQIRLALPGVRPEDVTVQIHGNELNITGERKQDVTPSDDRVFQREISYGTFERVVMLPEGVQTEKLEANFKNGLLELSAPLSEKAMPRRIEIKAAPEGKKLAA
ncbi:MAG: Hsp20/alpha crystallin family protein [Terriglobales bacterium]